MKEINQNEFKETVKEGFTLVDVSGDNCQPCKVLHQMLEVLEKENPFVNIVEINANKNPEFADEYAVMAVPTLLFMKDGELMHKEIGVLSVDKIMQIAGEYLY